jgi:hypothetical protein
MPEENIMKNETVLPVDFDGTFKFTNSWPDEEFIGKWGKKDYHYAANSTSPMIIPESSPLEIQNIRKKFAKDWAEQDFFKNSAKYKQYFAQERNTDGTARLNSIHQSVAYTIDDLKEGIQKCLKPLEIKRAFVESIQETPLEDVLSRNDDGELNSVIVDEKKTSLRDKALKGRGTVDN